MTSPDCKSAHVKYLLTCEEFQTVPGAATQECAACSIPAMHTKEGRLFIDHDGYLGRWAVRGMLCNSCNTSLGMVGDRPTPGSPLARYLENSWYLRLGPVMEEPQQVGIELRGRWRMRWTLTETGWTSTHCYTYPRKWRQVVMSTGPYLYVHSVGPHAGQCCPHRCTGV